jgi:RNA-directed DNA polymerase
MERRGGSCAEGSEAKRERGDGLEGITTPALPETATRVRKLQGTLYRQAKSKPKWKAWSLYADASRRDILEAALQQVIKNKGTAGVDGERWEPLKENRELRKQWLGQLQEELKGKTYRPSPVRRVYILKENGKQRPLGIPTLKDRVVQTAVVLLLLPMKITMMC